MNREATPLPPPREDCHIAALGSVEDLAHWCRLDSVAAARHLARQLPDACKLRIGRLLRFRRELVMEHLGAFAPVTPHPAAKEESEQ